MSIPSSSSVLIRGVNIPSLALSCYLAQAGINVLLIDEESRLAKENEFVSFDSYSTDFLNEIRIKTDVNSSTKDFFKNAKEILLHKMCTVSWGTSIVRNDLGKDFQLIDLHNKIFQHQTSFFIDSEKLEINSDLNLSIKNVALFSWKIEGIINGNLNQHILTQQKIEENLLEAYALKKPNILEKFLKQKNNAFNLRESKLNLHLSQQRIIEAGDLLPNLAVFDERLKQETNFYNWCKFGEFHLLILGSTSQHNLFNVAKWIKSNFPLRLFYLPNSESNEQIFDYFSVIEGEKKLIIVRPDRYIGLILDRLDLEVLENYLANVLQLQTKGKPISQKLIGSNIIENYP
ncbi:hypothetical protein Pedsa_2741 [Pseudopedobacter saltans DSM 12145]|uniref:FAD-binding domain-containing protein n=1 Tax=Pseudopedobacter saltans (strain ATCC 51119 / DSM 12145 / JCM 21818 / CCUG 39354 / LMG 10337 / NBRC 100064 / NCIMB 13643) TaxID=762903 RepID=F0S719_PSESL|nr:hypothetical protein [Pseudopedobacter saltans]ADY53282.1 hypothetical protein Pedsa_2741 [Pseudopedobacter saltans DSM 12145]